MRITCEVAEYKPASSAIPCDDHSSVRSSADLLELVLAHEPKLMVAGVGGKTSPLDLMVLCTLAHKLCGCGDSNLVQTDRVIRKAATKTGLSSAGNLQ